MFHKSGGHSFRHIVLLISLARIKREYTGGKMAQRAVNHPLTRQTRVEPRGLTADLPSAPRLRRLRCANATSRT